VATSREQQLNYFEGIELTDDMFMQDTNDFISDGKTWRLVRNRIADLFDEKNPKLRDIAKHRDIVIFKMDEVEMQACSYRGLY
jgi:fumarylacetoacetase